MLKESAIIWDLPKKISMSRIIRESFCQYMFYQPKELWQYESALFYSDEDAIRAYMLRKLNVAGAENGQMFVTVDEVASAERREMEAMYPVLGEMEP